MSFAVLGLGDTNYDKFCFMGKSIDKRLGELGGERVLPLECADEATNLEEVVERWRANVAEAVNRFLSCPSSLTHKSDNLCTSSAADPQSTSGAVAITGTESAAAVPATQATDHSSKVEAFPADKLPDYAAELKENRNCFPMNFNQLSQVALLTGVCSNQLEFENLLESHILTAPREKHEVVATELMSDVDATAFYLEQQGHINSGKVSTFGGGCNAEKTFEAAVVSARWLTEKETSLSLFRESSEKWGEGKRVVALDLSLAGSDIEYLPGDALAICCPNPPYAVRLVLDRLKQNSNVNLQSLVRFSSAGKTEILSVEDLLTYRLDLCALPKKTQLTSLARYCTNVKEKKMLSLLAGKEQAKKQLFTHFVEQQYLNIAELLYLFPSCQPSLSELAQLALPLVPRYYSLCSSPLAQGEVASVAFSLVRYQCRIKDKQDEFQGLQTVRRSGVCTSFLEDVLSPWLYPVPTGGSKQPLHNQRTANVTLRVFHRSTPHFHLPASVATPMVLIGPGTGVAPFIGFLQHRDAQQRDRLTRLHPCHSTSHERDLNVLSRSNSANQSNGTFGSPSKLSQSQLLNLKKKRMLAVSELMSEGVWRGGFELDSEDLPCEGNGVESFLDRVQCGDISLYFGCRDERDFLFKQQLEGFHTVSNSNSCNAGVLTEWHVGFSRLPNQPKVYVTHLLESQSERIAQLLMEKQCAVYICGDGTAMAKDVLKTLGLILVRHGHCEDEAAADDLLTKLKTRKRLNLDIWS
jgi:methionine synthase reductase